MQFIIVLTDGNLSSAFFSFLFLIIWLTSITFYIMIKLREGNLHVSMVLLPLYVRAIQPKPPEEDAVKGIFIFCAIK